MIEPLRRALRTSADRCRLRAPAVSVGEELADDEDGGGEAEGGVSVPCSAVGGAPNLAFDFDDALLQLADPGLELLDELTQCAILGLKVDVARYAG